MGISRRSGPHSKDKPVKGRQLYTDVTKKWPPQQRQACKGETIIHRRNKEVAPKAKTSLQRGHNYSQM